MDDIAVRHIRRAVKLNSLFRYHPYAWSESCGGRVTYGSKNVYKRIFFCFHVGLYWSNEAVLLFRALYVTFFHQEDTSISTRIDIQYVAVGFFAPMTFYFCSLSFCSQLHVMLNRYLSFWQELQVEWNRMRPTKKCKSLRKFTWCPDCRYGKYAFECDDDLEEPGCTKCHYSVYSWCGKHVHVATLPFCCHPVLHFCKSVAPGLLVLHVDYWIDDSCCKRSGIDAVS